jgi:hypothetical protein
MTVDRHMRTTAAAASATLRDLAHATIAINDPEDLYPLVGDFLGSVRSLAQVAKQIARAHLEFRPRARDDVGEPAAGILDASEAARAMRQASAVLDAVESSVDLASQHSGRIAWEPVEREGPWVSVVFLQGEDADETLEIIDRHGPERAVSHLAQWDCGDETTDAALVNGYVYDTIPICSTDSLIEAEHADYALTYNRPFRYVSLLRRYPADAQRTAFSAPSTLPTSFVPRLSPPWIAAPTRAVGLAVARGAL